MINASKEFKEKLKNGANIVNYADITLSDGTVLPLTYKDFLIGGCQIEDKTTDGKFGVGFCIGKTLSIKLENNDERFSQYDFYNSIINLYVALLLDDGAIEKIRKGVYYATVPETPGDVVEISAIDGMYRLDRDYSESTLAYPATLQQIITGACLDCGIPIGFRQFDNMNFVVQEKPEKATYRQVVSWACQIAGYNARIDNNGYMQLVWYDTSILDRRMYDGGDFKVYPHDENLDGGDFAYKSTAIVDGGSFTDPAPENIYKFKTSPNVHTDDVIITGVQVTVDETEALFGEHGYVISIDGNPFAAGKEQNVANYLGARMVGLVFRPFSGEVLNNPLYEPFDVARIFDRKGNMYQAVINSVSYTVGGYTQIACEAEDPVRNGSNYYSASAAAVVESRRSTKKQITEYDKAVQQMNQLAGNAMGFHSTVEDQPDSSRIMYLHDKPTLAASRTIYKQTIDGFFVSRDGGQSYTAGFDASGNAVVNILYAIGIVCDWIRGGTLTLGGANNINGLLRILNAAGKEIGRWDRNGIFVDGGTIRSVTSASTVSISGGLMNLINADTNVGYIGTNAWANLPDIKGIVFDLKFDGSYMGWAAEMNAGDPYYIIKWVYAKADFESFQEDSLNAGCNLDMHNWHIRNSIIDDFDVRSSFKIPNNVTCDIWSDVNFHGYTINNVKITDMYSDVDFHNWSIKSAVIDGFNVKNSFTIPNNVACNIYSDVNFNNFAIKNAKISDMYSDVNFNNHSIKNAVIDGFSVKNSFTIPGIVNCNIYSDVDFHERSIKNAVISDMYSDVNFHDHSIKNAIIDGLSVKNSFFIPNNVTCNIWSNVYFHGFRIYNANLYNIQGINGYETYTGSIDVVTSVSGDAINGIHYNTRTIQIENGLIVGA